MPGSIQYSIALCSNGADTDKQVTSKTHEYKHLRKQKQNNNNE